MKIRIRKGVGTYGHHEGGIIRPKDYNSGAFEVPDNVGRNLIARGLADLVSAPPANIATPKCTKLAPAPAKKTAVKPAPEKELDEMTISELRAKAKARGVKNNARLSRAQLLDALCAPAAAPEGGSTEDESAPSFNPTAAIA